MKPYLRAIVFSGLLAVALNLIPQCCNAQTIGDPGEDPDAPIDGGVSLLVAAGVGYGIKKARDSRKKNKIAHMPEQME